MTEREATELVEYVILDRGPDSAVVHPLASGKEFVVRIKSDDYWLWSFADYTVFRQAEEDAGRKSPPRRKGKVTTV